jgi:hypothetical protein
VDDINFFHNGRYTTCKKCKTSSSNNLTTDKKSREIPENKISKEHIHKYVLNDYNIFGGFSLLEIIRDLKNRCDYLEKEIDTIKNQNKNINMEFKNLSYTLLENEKGIFKILENIPSYNLSK